MIKITSLGFAYNHHATLRNINLKVAPGEMMALLGPNGVGKSTLLKLAAGVLKHSEGRIELGGRDLRSLRRAAIAKQVAFVPQEVQMPFDFIVREMVFLGRTPHLGPIGTSHAYDWLVVNRALVLTGVQPWADRTYNSLSMGQRQKVHLAMALAQEPRLLLLDEPTAHLDISHQLEILDLLQSQNRHDRVTVIAAMHDLNLAAMYFDRLVLLHQGTILADGTPQEVLQEKHISLAFNANVEIHHFDGELRVLVKKRGNFMTADNQVSTEIENRFA